MHLIITSSSNALQWIKKINDAFGTNSKGMIRFDERNALSKDMNDNADDVKNHFVRVVVVLLSESNAEMMKNPYLMGVFLPGNLGANPVTRTFPIFLTSQNCATFPATPNSTCPIICLRWIINIILSVISFMFLLPVCMNHEFLVISFMFFFDPL